MKAEGFAIEREFGLREVKKGTMLFSEGGFCTGVPYLKKGKLKVYLISEGGREVTLYHVLEGQMCILAMITAYSGCEYPAYTVAEEDSLVALVPASVAVRWLEEKSWWRSLFMKNLAENTLSLLNILNYMLSESVERRLIKYLLNHGASIIDKTQEDIAKDIGSVRVVVNRVLKELEREGFLRVQRGRIKIINCEGLKRRLEALLG